MSSLQKPLVEIWQPHFSHQFHKSKWKNGWENALEAMCFVELFLSVRLRLFREKKIRIYSITFISHYFDCIKFILYFYTSYQIYPHLNFILLLLNFTCHYSGWYPPNDGTLFSCLPLDFFYLLFCVTSTHEKKLSFSLLQLLPKNPENFTNSVKHLLYCKTIDELLFNLFFLYNQSIWVSPRLILEKNNLLQVYLLGKFEAHLTL